MGYRVGVLSPFITYPSFGALGTNQISEEHWRVVLPTTILRKAGAFGNSKQTRLCMDFIIICLFFQVFIADYLTIVVLQVLSGVMLLTTKRFEVGMTALP